jgi:hypothetical protein
VGDAEVEVAEEMLVDEVEPEPAVDVAVGGEGDGLARAMKMCQGAAMARKTMVLEMGASCLMRERTPRRLRRVSARWARTMRRGKTMPINPLVRTLRAQQAAKAQQRMGLGLEC